MMQPGMQPPGMMQSGNMPGMPNGMMGMDRGMMGGEFRTGESEQLDSMSTNVGSFETTFIQQEKKM